MKWLIIILALLIATPLLALEPGEALENPQQEARARALMEELRCMVCQNETIEASRAPFATEVRRLVREQVVAGRTDQEIKLFLSSRYGDAILFRPPMGPATWALWLTPFLLLVFGGVAVIVSVRKASRPLGDNSLSTAEKAELAKALEDGD